MAKSAASASASFAFSKSTVAAVKSAFSKAAKIEESAKTARNTAGQRLVDELQMLCDIPNREAFFKKVKARAACLEVFGACAGLSESAVKNYPTSVKLAFIHDVPFSASLFTKDGQAAAGLNLTPTAGNDKKSGGVVTTTKAATLKTAGKLLQQLRLVGELDAAAAVLDTLIEYFPDFVETEEEATV